MIDGPDRRLLTQLQKQGRRSNQDLASDIGISSSACWRRVRALEESGIITRYAALVDREKAGFSTSAILQVSLDRHDEKSACKAESSQEEKNLKKAQSVNRDGEGKCGHSYGPERYEAVFDLSRRK